MIDNKNINGKKNENQNNNPNAPYNHSERELLLNPEMNYRENPIHIIGPLYIVGGVLGVFTGIINGYKQIHYYFPRIIKNNTKVKISKYLTEIINHSNHLSNCFGSFGIVNYIVSNSMNLMIQEAKIIKIPQYIKANKYVIGGIKLLNNKNRNLLRNFSQGFLSGMAFKCHQGIKTSLITGVICGNSFLLLSFLLNNKKYNV